MLNGKKVIVILPADYAAKTLEMTWSEIPFAYVDDVVLGDDASRDDTAEQARQLGINKTIAHTANRGCGGNQKTCYGEVSCPTKYFPESSSISFRRSVVYGLGVIRTALHFRLARHGLMAPGFLEH